MVVNEEENEDTPAVVAVAAVGPDNRPDPIIFDDAVVIDFGGTTNSDGSNVPFKNSPQPLLLWLLLRLRNRSSLSNRCCETDRCSSSPMDDKPPYSSDVTLLKPV